MRNPTFPPSAPAQTAASAAAPAAVAGAVPLHSPSWSNDQEAGFERFVARLVPKARAAVEKHVDACAADAALGYGRLWKRLAELLGRLAPHAVEVSGTALRFYIADGKYRRQVFALEDSRKGIIQLCLPDVTVAGMKLGLLGKPEGQMYPVLQGGATHLKLESFGADTAEIPDYCKGMLGWGRRALRVNLEAGEDGKQVRAVERLCQVAAEVWADAAASGNGTAGAV